MVFIGVSIIILFIFGLMILLVIGDLLVNCGCLVWSIVVGVVVGDMIVMVVFFVGVGVLLVVLVVVFMVFKFIGGLYFVYLGIKFIFSVCCFCDDVFEVIIFV